MEKAAGSALAEATAAATAAAAHPEKTAIRTATLEDVPALRAIYAPYVRGTAITFEYEAPTEAEFAGRIEHTLARYPYLVAERDSIPVGYAYLGPFGQRAAYGWSAETSLYVDRSLLHAGVGGALHAALEACARAQGIVNLCACITVPAQGTPDDERANRNSMQFHEHMGYRLAGRFSKAGYKFGHWYDVVWMEKHLGPHREAVDGGQPPVHPFPEVRPQLVTQGVLCS